MNTLAYSTNTMTTTPDDLHAMRSAGPVIRRPQVAKQPFSRLTDGVRHEVSIRRVPVIGVAVNGTEPAEHACTKGCYERKA